MSAGAQTPPPDPAPPASLAVVVTARVPFPAGIPAVIDPADRAAVDWLCRLFAAGQADLYTQDEADLALLPTLTRTWMPRGEQLKVKAPGTNEKRSVSTATDLADGTLLWQTDDKRCAVQFCATIRLCVDRSTARGRFAVLLVDNAPSHRVGKTGIVRTALDELAGRVILVFLPPYSPDLAPAERLWRQWRPNVTHNHTRSTLAELEADSDRWLTTMAAEPRTVLQALALPITQPNRKAA